ncbi:protein PRRC1-like [Leguminivora glycinivorella]|uniref:protein PRRC1-like n=1 Tax=Leguminivora glycinivorella TaxID=1035111 RepID=UPI002010AC1A|nr:protein PRRC1-like [Leguminivora glycinivorella]XP_047996514.1 protein PRRC1-like [Leguminivora glycinivorella]
MSNNEKKRIPDAPVPAAAPGNLLSSVAPPSQLPNFVTTSPAPVPVAVVPQLPPELAATLAPAPPVSIAPTPPVAPTSVPIAPAIIPAVPVQPDSPDRFCPAIPPSKGEPMLSIRSPEDSQNTQSPDSLPDTMSEVDKLGDIMPGTGLFTWVKGAVASGGILQRVAEKAKNSVDSMITTLDPQMKEYLNSGGDVNIVVASDKDVKISPVREAFQIVFGKATVTGYEAQSDVTAAQPVGYAAAYAAAKQRIAEIRSAHTEVHNNIPIVAVEGFLHEAVADRWYAIDLLVLSQPSLGIELQLQSQGCPVPAAAVAAARANTPEDYAHIQTGFSVTVPSVMADSLQVPHTQWHEASTGVSRRELLLLAAKSLAGSYKKLLAVSAAEI